MLTEAQVAVALELYANRDFDMTVDQIGRALDLTRTELCEALDLVNETLRGNQSTRSGAR